MADTIHSHIGTMDEDGDRIDVSLRIVFDGIEYIGRLWFAHETGGGAAVPDRAALPGRSHEEVAALAQRLTPAEMRQRYGRALAEKRRYRPLRRATEDILAKIRHLNRLAISLHAGLIDGADAAGEIAATETQLHDLVERLRTLAGIEDEESVPT